MPTLLTASSFAATPRFLFDPYALNGTAHGTALSGIADQSGNGNNMTVYGTQPTYYASDGWGVKLENNGYLHGVWQAWVAGRCSVIYFSEPWGDSGRASFSGAFVMASQTGTDYNQAGGMTIECPSLSIAFATTTTSTVDGTRSVSSVYRYPPGGMRAMLQNYGYAWRHFSSYSTAPYQFAMNARITSGSPAAANTLLVVRFVAVWDDALTNTQFDSAVSIVVSEMRSRAIGSPSRPTNFSGGFTL